MSQYEVLKEGDPRIPPQMERAKIKASSNTGGPRAAYKPREMVRGNPGYLHPKLDQRLHVDTMAQALLEAQGQPCPATLAYLDNPAMPAPHPLASLSPEGLSPEDREKLAMNRGRSLLPPLTWSDVNLRRYLIHLTPLALSPSKTSTYPDSLSPRMALLFLGGIGTGALEELTERAMEVLHFEDETVDPTLNYAMRLIGFGAGQRHSHSDGVNLQKMEPFVGEEVPDYLKRITGSEPPMPPLHFDSAKHGIATYYLRHTVGPFATLVDNGDNYRFELLRKVTRHKWWVIAKARELFNPYAEHIPEASRDAIATPREWLDSTQPGHVEFSNAVRMVFEQPWHKLDLTGALKQDVTKVMAKLLIHRLGRGVRKTASEDSNVPTMSARALVGISLLTGVPTPKYVRFALDELKRRGETFLTPAIVRRAITLVDESEDVFQYASSEWMEEMNHLALQLEHHHHEPRAYFAGMLRRGTKPLTSSQGVYQIVGYRDGEEDEPIYKPRINPKLDGLHEEL